MVNINIKHVEIMEKGDGRDLYYLLEVDDSIYNVKVDPDSGNLESVRDRDNFLLPKEDWESDLGNGALITLKNKLGHFQKKLWPAYASVNVTLEHALIGERGASLVNEGGVCSLPDYHKGGQCLRSEGKTVATVFDITGNRESLNVSFTIGAVAVYVHRTGVAPVLASISEEIGEIG